MNVGWCVSVAPLKRYSETHLVGAQPEAIRGVRKAGEEVREQVEVVAGRK